MNMQKLFLLFEYLFFTVQLSIIFGLQFIAGKLVNCGIEENMCKQGATK